MPEIGGWARRIRFGYASIRDGVLLRIRFLRHGKTGKRARKRAGKTFLIESLKMLFVFLQMFNRSFKQHSERRLEFVIRFGSDPLRRFLGLRVH